MVPNIQQLYACEGCVYGKQIHKSFPSEGAARATECFELIHADLVGPMKTESLGGKKYFILFTYDSSHIRWVFFIKFKPQALECFK